jgi:micrococcal nuclease
MRSIFGSFAIGALVLSTTALAVTGDAPAPLKGRVSAQVLRVDDGDTLAVLAGGARHKIRLSDIDAPETSHCTEARTGVGKCARPGQPFGGESGQKLARLVAGGRVDLACSDYDSRYSRSVCRVYANGVDVNAEMVRSGLAWFNDKYSKDNDLRRAQDQAKRAGLGLWSDRGAVAPWVWRDLCWKRGVCR